MTTEEKLEPEEKLYFRDCFRQARANVLRDAEAFSEIIFVFERMRIRLRPQCTSLREFAPVLSSLAANAPAPSGLQTPFDELFALLVDERNAAMHEGAFARHLATHAVNAALIMEDSLMNKATLVRDFMVQNPIRASMWQPLSFIRHTMLANSFSNLPILDGDGEKAEWKFVTDLVIARYLRSAPQEDLRNRLAEPLKDAVKAQKIDLVPAKICDPEDGIQNLIEGLNHHPALVLRKGSNELVGILTAYDLL